jgi:hypothetical protein
MHEVFREHRLTQAVRGDEDDVLSFREKVEGEDAFDRGTVDLFRPVPFLIGHGFEAAEACVSKPAFDAVPHAGIELRLREVFKQDDGTPALLRRAGDEIIQLGRGVDEPELPQVVTQGCRDRIE